MPPLNRSRPSASQPFLPFGSPEPQEMTYLMSEASSAAFIISPKAIGESQSASGPRTHGAGPYVRRRLRSPSRVASTSSRPISISTTSRPYTSARWSVKVVEPDLDDARSDQVRAATTWPQETLRRPAPLKPRGSMWSRRQSRFMMMEMFLDRGPETPDGSASNPLASVKVRPGAYYCAHTRSLFGRHLPEVDRTAEVRALLWPATTGATSQASHLQNRAQEVVSAS